MTMSISALRLTTFWLVLLAAASCSTLLAAEGGVKLEKVPYGGWPNCIRLSNGTVELIATTDVGPRVIRYGFAAKESEFFEDPRQMGKTNAKEWLAFGGHRLWVAPRPSPGPTSPTASPSNGCRRAARCG